MSQQPLYPKVVDSNPDLHSPFLSGAKQSLYPSLDSNPPPPPPPSSSTSSLYPTIDMNDLATNLFPDAEDDPLSAAQPAPVEETLLRIPGAILHLIDRHNSVELASGDLTLVRLRQGPNTVAVLARVAGDAVQWPLAKDEAAVKLDASHYFFSLHVPAAHADAHADADADADADLLNYGLTVPSGDSDLVRELDAILESYSSFSVEKVAPEMHALDGNKDGMKKDGKKKDAVKKDGREEASASAAYWTTLAPNVEDYSGSVARVIAKGSGLLIKGILWSGDVTVDRLKWGEDLFKRKLSANAEATEVSKDALKRMKRVKKVTKMSEKVATGVLSGVIKVSGFFTSSVVNSKAGKKFFSLLPGEIVLASLDGFGKICDAVEVAGRNVMQTSSVVTTGVVSHRYGEQAGEITNEGMSAAGHAFGTAWAVFKIRKALNPKGAMKPTTLVKSAANAAVADLKAKKGKK